MWTAPLHDASFVQRLLGSVQSEGSLGATLDSRRRLEGMLTSVLEELPDVPLFQQLAHMCSVLHTTCPTNLAVVSALMRQVIAM